jgi:hypothetical protein
VLIFILAFLAGKYRSWPGAKQYQRKTGLAARHDRCGLVLPDIHRMLAKKKSPAMAPLEKDIYKLVTDAAQSQISRLRQSP